MCVCGIYKFIFILKMWTRKGCSSLPLFIKSKLNIWWVSFWNEQKLVLYYPFLVLNIFHIVVDWLKVNSSYLVPGLGTAFFSVQNVLFFSILLKNAKFFSVLFLSFWRLMEPKRKFCSFPFLSQYRWYFLFRAIWVEYSFVSSLMMLRKAWNGWDMCDRLVASLRSK